MNSLLKYDNTTKFARTKTCMIKRFDYKILG